MRRFFWIFLTANSLGLMLSGCAELDYYRQAVVGQWELLDARRPVVDVLADPATAPALRQRLATARALRMFASVELALPSNGSYHDYADLGRPYAVKNVFAAPELSLEPRRWCYLAVGCLSYRGYFDDEAARQLADQLRTAGDDVFVADIPAYSTLGWFDDPLLNTFINWSTARLAELMFHELAHQRLYIADDTAFNEAFATAVGQLGAERWLERADAIEEREAYRVDRHRRDEFLRLVGATRDRLATVYGSSRDEAEKRLEKQRILTEMRDRYRELKRDWGGYSGYDRWVAEDLNNAKLAGNSTYYRWVPGFVALYGQEGRDFAMFYRTVETLGQLPAAERAARLEVLSSISTSVAADSGRMNGVLAGIRLQDR